MLVFPGPPSAPLWRCRVGHTRGYEKSRAVGLMPFTFGSYFVNDDAALVAALDFDEACLANYDFGGTSAPDTVDISDIGRMIGSRMVGMNALEAAELIRLGPSAPWHGVPIDARLEDAAPGTKLFGAAMALRAHFEAISGVKEAKATKLLAMKRPALFPVIDERVVRLYRVAAHTTRRRVIPNHGSYPRRRL